MLVFIAETPQLIFGEVRLLSQYPTLDAVDGLFCLKFLAGRRLTGKRWYEVPELIVPQRDRGQRCGTFIRSRSTWHA